jgi:solute carrier family 25 citrate transporter 1
LQSPLSTGAIIRRTYAISGLGGFYTGCGTLALSNALKSGVRFYSFATARSYFQSIGLGGPSLNVAAGLFAGVAESVIVVTPGEALKTRMIQEATSGSGTKRLGTFGIAGKVLQTEGIGALWKGLGPVMAKQATNSAVRFATFESLKEQVAKQWPGKDDGIAVALGLGALSGIVTV